jgi:thioredoxin:protein disulfide reductase
MRKILVISAMVFGSVGLAQDTAVVTVPRDTLAFATGDVAASIARAKKEKKRLLMDFWADWCLPCKQMDRLTFSDSLVMLHLRKDYIIHRVDVSQFAGMDVAEARKVDKYPTIIVLDKKGIEATRMQGFQSVDALMTELRRIEALAPPPAKAGKKGKH